MQHAYKTLLLIASLFMHISPFSQNINGALLKMTSKIRTPKHIHLQACDGLSIRLLSTLKMYISFL